MLKRNDWQADWKQKDHDLALKNMGDARVRNFYGAGHSQQNWFTGLTRGQIMDANKNKRFRFAFVDGCNSGQGGSATVLDGFGATSSEISSQLTLRQIRAIAHGGTLTGLSARRITKLRTRRIPID